MYAFQARLQDAGDEVHGRLKEAGAKLRAHAGLDRYEMCFGKTTHDLVCIERVQDMRAHARVAAAPQAGDGPLEGCNNGLDPSNGTVRSES